MSWDSNQINNRVKELERQLKFTAESIVPNDVAEVTPIDVMSSGRGIGQNTKVLGAIRYPFIFNSIDSRRYDDEDAPYGTGTVYDALYITSTSVTVTPKDTEAVIEIRDIPNALFDGQIVLLSTKNNKTVRLLPPTASYGNIRITENVEFTQGSVIFLQWRVTASTLQDPSGGWIIVSGGGGSGGEFLGPWTATHDAGTQTLTNLGHINLTGAIASITGIVNLTFDSGQAVTGALDTLTFGGGTGDKFDWFVGGSTIATLNDTLGLDLRNHALRGVTVINMAGQADMFNVDTINFENSGQNITSQSSGLRFNVPSGEDFSWYIGSVEHMSLSFTGGLDLKDNQINNCTAIYGSVFTINFLGDDQHITASSSLMFINIDSDNSLTIAADYVNFIKFDDDDDEIKMYRNIDMSNNNIENVSHFTGVTNLSFNQIGKSMQTAGNDLVTYIPNSGAWHVRQGTSGFNDLLEVDISDDVIKAYTDIHLTSGEAIRADTSTEIGYFTTNTTASVGTRGTMQIPVAPSLTTTVANLDAAFGSAIGCIGIVENTSFTRLCLKVSTGKWRAMVIGASGNVTSVTYTN